MLLTSITAYESTEGFSRGDIDGSPGPYTCNFTGPYTYPELPFSSDTQDSIDELDQTTQELRLASDTTGPLSWQTGVYLFDSSFTITTVGPGGYPFPTTLKHENTSWAVFGQASYAVSDVLTLTGGLRYTDDEKDLPVLNDPISNHNVADGDTVNISDDHISWDISAMYDISPDFSVFARIADGFRGPSIQGRDIAFDNPPSVAQSESVISYEAGFKSTLLDDTLRLNAAAFTYEVSDIQFTAVGGGGNLVQLVNADKGKAWGFEVDA